MKYRRKMKLNNVERAEASVAIFAFAVCFSSWSEYEFEYQVFILSEDVKRNITVNFCEQRKREKQL